LYDTDPAILFSKANVSENPLFLSAIESQLSNGAREYEFNGSRYLGSYVFPGLNLAVLTSTEWQKAMKATYMLIEKFILLGSMAVGAAIVFAIFFSKTLTAPIGQLYEATKEVSKGNFLFELEEKGKDEISALSRSFNAMSKRIDELVQESMQKVHLENELAIASTVQQTLIPPEEFLTSSIRINSHYQSASECGGDWWGFFGVGQKIAITIADATGHGLPSALMTASARSCFSVMHKLAQEDPEFSFSPSAMLSFANRVIYDASQGKIMMTFFMGVIDFETNTLTYSSAAHNPPWLFKKEEERFIQKSLTAVGHRLGESRESIPFEEKTVSISPGDILFLYTDGLTEGKDQNGEMYGKKRVRRALESGLAEGPKVMISNLMEDFLRYNDGKSLDDDVTVAAAQILPGKTLEQINA
jgi:sigma-B regulation protein RsbU (phosphoserine phosphatase)